MVRTSYGICDLIDGYQSKQRQNKTQINTLNLIRFEYINIINPTNNY